MAVPRLNNLSYCVAGTVVWRRVIAHRAAMTIVSCGAYSTACRQRRRLLVDRDSSRVHDIGLRCGLSLVRVVQHHHHLPEHAWRALTLFQGATVCLVDLRVIRRG